MHTWTFSALGTQWSIDTDGDDLTDIARGNVSAFVSHFEKRFSRFLEQSEVNAFRQAQAGEYAISTEFAELLSRAMELRELTAGAYDPAVGVLMEGAGYDATYRFSADESIERFRLPRWSLDGETLTIDGPVVFDLGGIGKGYCIDRVSDILAKHGYAYRIVEGGGDMVATEKRNGEAFRVALEWPGRPDTAAGIVELRHQGLAASDSFRRRWGTWHHILDPHTKEPIRRVVGCVALASSAWDADCMTSGLFLSPEHAYVNLAQSLRSRYLIFREDSTVLVSHDWPGELF